MNNFKEELINNYKWLKTGGTLLIVSSCLFILNFIYTNSYSLFAGYFLSSIVILIQGIRFWYRKLLGLLLHIGAAILNITFLIVIIFNYIELFQYYTYAYIFSFLLIGLFRIYTGISQTKYYPSWVITAVCGLVNFCMGITLFIYPTFDHLVFSCFLDFLLTGISLLVLGQEINYRNNISIVNR